MLINSAITRVGLIRKSMGKDFPENSADESIFSSLKQSLGEGERNGVYSFIFVLWMNCSIVPP